jgi:exodeoxyribonuclease-3
MAFRKKAEYILAHKPDILVVPECEHPDKLEFGPAMPVPKNMLWFGGNKNKGLGIFSYANFRIKLIRNYNAALKMIIPISVKGNGSAFTLYAVWANNPEDPDGQYVEQVWKAIKYYDKKLRSKATMLIGDFNSNAIWDRKYRIGNHSHVVKRLEEKKIFSCYHLHYKQIQGKEAHPTFYLYKHKDKPYHLDYCFASMDMIDKMQSVVIGEYDFWRQYSDHVPVIITFNPN